MDTLEITTKTHWLDTHVDKERAKLIRQLFPFRTPPLNVARNCLRIVDPSLHLQSAFHETSSSIFLSPRGDNKILVPAVVFETQPPFNLWVMISDTLPITHEVTNRRWATWCGRNILKTIPVNLFSFTPESGDKVLEQSRKAKDIYRQLLAGKDRDKEELRQIMRDLGIVGGGWLKYYTEEIPRLALDEPEKAAEVIDQIFEGLEGKIENAKSQFGELPPENQQLLRNPIRIIIKASFKEPYVYFSEAVDVIRRNLQHTLVDGPFVRDPLEIVGRSQGVSLGEVEAIFLPDHLDTDAARIVKDRISKMGLSKSVKPASEIGDGNKYTTCDLRYGRTTPGLLAQYIATDRFVPLVPSEWKDAAVYNNANF